ncbi:FERM domain-containing protein 8 isoform X1 [Acinonyx jubatus]|uniref:FERM domain-containing protein 8 n=1 Tax=Acinonyx jubatus TaxID=32536 RepID=A0ABM3NHL7_ACIJB|nr:FERM domain-containing protein 8 isoform X1 [Acinonyx jubatus]XP_053058914.1 FERM domain-containing protein 8 isoform X1 [Acinonyx jubatus]
MDGTEGNVGQPGPAERSHRSSVSSVGARAADVLVYLADDTVVPLAVENLPSLNAHELHRAVREVLQLPDIALDVFALWLVSPLLEVQLKPKHQPYKLGRQWPELLLRFTDAPDDDVAMDEPSLQFRRNVFFPKRRELQIHDEEVLRLLYEEAKGNVLAARYPCDVEDCEALGALVCRVQLGPYQPGQPTACAVREKLDSFLPAHLCKRGHGLFAALRGRGAKAGPGEQGLLNAYCKVKEAAGGDSGRGASLSTHYRAYLLKSHELPFYGCAFFHGEVDKPAQGFLHRGGRKPVVVAISLEGVHVIDSREKHVLLGLRFQELSWDHTSPEEEESVLWLEFDGDNEGTPVNRLLKIYSKQAELMSGLIEYCIELNQTSELATPQETVSGPPSAASSLPSPAQRPQLQRQGSVVCSRLQHLSTIDYVEEENAWGRGKERGRGRIRSRLQAPSCRHRTRRGARTHKWSADQAGETEAHHVLLQPAAVRGPGELHRGAAR